MLLHGGVQSLAFRALICPVTPQHAVSLSSGFGLSAWLRQTRYSICHGSPTLGVKLCEQCQQDST